MNELMHTNQILLEREMSRTVQQELRDRRVWLWGVPTHNGERASVPSKPDVADASEDRVDAPKRGRAVLNLIRLSME